MRRLRWTQRAVGLVAWLSIAVAAAAAPRLDTALIEEVTGVKGVFDAQQGVYRLAVPRDDLPLSIAGAKLPAPLGRGAWVAFQPVADQTMLMGELLLREDEVTPVLDAVLANGLEVTALQQDLLWEAPPIVSMHIAGVADTGALAGAVRQVLAALKASAGRTAPRLAPSVSAGLDRAGIDAALGRTGQAAGGVYTVAIGRPATLHGYPIGGAMGVESWASFRGSDAQAVVAGAIAVRAVELQPVLRALRGGGLSVTAIHNHMTMEEPRLFFVHFWGSGSTRILATAVRGALSAQEK